MNWGGGWHCRCSQLGSGAFPEQDLMAASNRERIRREGAGSQAPGDQGGPHLEWTGQAMAGTFALLLWVLKILVWPLSYVDWTSGPADPLPSPKDSQR